MSDASGLKFVVEKFIRFTSFRVDGMARVYPYNSGLQPEFFGYSPTPISFFALSGCKPE
jgi:hypothetical protein